MRPDEGADSQEERRRERRRPPLLAMSIVRRVTNEHSLTDIEELCNRIYGGVLTTDNKLFWVDEKLDKNCFLLLAKGLSIVWIEDPRYWRWALEKMKCYKGYEDVPVAELLGLSRLQIEGKFKTMELSPKTTYEVSFVVKRTEPIINWARAWGLPVNLNLTLPDKTTQGRIENMKEKPKEEWLDLLVGTFKTTPENVGEMSFSFSETTDSYGKSGLVVKGVFLRPKD